MKFNFIFIILLLLIVFLYSKLNNNNNNNNNTYYELYSNDKIDNNNEFNDNNELNNDNNELNNDNNNEFNDNNELNNNNNTYYELYSNDKYPEIIISLTTSPKRLPNIKPVIDSIMNQTLLPDKIVLNLPFVFKRFDSAFDNIPIFIIDNPKIIINRCEDIGPITKILPTIPLAKDMDSIIISIDDDIIYLDTFIELLVNEAQLNPNHVITGSAVSVTDNDSFELAEGYGGILYRKKFLVDFPFDDIKNFNKACYLGDDLVISNYLAEKNIPIKGVLNIRDDIHHNNRILSYGHEFDALHLSHENNTFHGHDYKSCIEHLKDNNKYYLKNFDNYLH